MIKSMQAEEKYYTKEMEKLGYEPTYVPGHSDMFLMWKAKNDETQIFGLDGWEAVQLFTDNIHKLMNNYTMQELKDRANNDYSIIEYSAFDDREVQAAIANKLQQENAREHEAKNAEENQQEAMHHSQQQAIRRRRGR